MIWKPMLFKGPMVRAFLRKENPKRRTRRIIKFEANERIKMPGSRKNWHPVAEAEVAKAEMNKGRPPMHGKKA